MVKIYHAALWVHGKINIAIFKSMILPHLDRNKYF